MKWLELHIDTARAGLEPVSELLREQGVEGLVIDDEADFKDFLENNHQYWDYVDDELLAEKHGKCRVTFYLEESESGFSTLAQVRIALSALKKQHPEYAPLLLTMENVEDADWENNWKQFYKPMEIGERLLVVPEWEQAEGDGRVKLILNPGLTFGTGSHATTRLCLQALEKHIHGGEKVLDLGCGSGILSIAALLLGAKDAFACDIDDKCVGVAYENAALNGVGREHYTVRAGDVLSDKGLQKEFGGDYDVIVANIVADVIIALAPQVGRLLKEGKHDAIKNAITIDSLENVLTKWELYSENLRRVVDGQEPLKIDSLMEVRKNPAAEAGDSRELAEKDSLLRKEVADEDRFDIKPGSARTLPIEGMHFFTPLKGVVSQGYDKALHPYIDITAPGNSVVMSVLDGTVISAGWNDTEGYTIRIQHEGDIISVYKHNQKLLKETGDKVTAGTPIAVLGGTGSTSDGDHLHFELWHKGEAVDPTKYISF